MVQFRGKTYVGHNLAILPVEGPPLGTATLPPCDDTPNDGLTGSAEEIDVAELPGVPPRVAVLWRRSERPRPRGRRPTAREGDQLLTPLTCLEADEPIEMSGRWNGILGADGNSELDLMPPYDVDLLVTTASASQYKRAFLTVRVPSSLGTPLSEDYVHASLWEGGTIEITATCKQDGFVATKVAAFRPS